jgi:hypothetical protein
MIVSISRDNRDVDICICLTKKINKTRLSPFLFHTITH